MALSKLCLSFLAAGAIAGVHALPSRIRSPYAVKERHEVPPGWTEVGPASKGETIHLQIGLKQGTEGVVEQHLIEVSNPSHSRYGKHLSAAEVHDLISPSEQTVKLVEDWLVEHGITNVAYNPAGDWLSAIVPIEKAEKLLETSYSTFMHHDGTTVSRAPEWSLPAHLHEHIDVVQPTTSFFRPERKIEGVRPVRNGPTYSMEWWEEVGKHMFGGHSTSGANLSAICNITFTTPTCIRTLYGTIDYKPKAAGKNKVSIANYLNETNKRADVYKALQNFRPEAADAAYEFKFVDIANAPNNQGPVTAADVAAGNYLEGDLDAETVLSIAWPTPMTSFLVGGEPPYDPDLNTPTDTNEPYLTFLNYALQQDDLPQVLSTSYGDDEQSVPYSYAKRVCAGFAQLGARGISVLFSSGDSGVGPSGACVSNKNNETMFIPEFPTSCPWVTSVGATQAFEPEIAVSRFGSGAGFSNYFGRPAYQEAAVDGYLAKLNGLYDGLYNKSGRGYPDVAAQGQVNSLNHDAVVWGGNITTIGGTSASVPAFSAVIALVNDALLAKGKPVLGFLNPWIYGGAYKALTDITSGSSIGCNSSGFPATEGWDAVTGYGTPNFGKLVAAAFEKEGGYGGHGW